MKKKYDSESYALLFSAIIIAHLAQSNYAQKTYDNDTRRESEWKRHFCGEHFFLVGWFKVWSYIQFNFVLDTSKIVCNDRKSNTRKNGIESRSKVISRSWLKIKMKSDPLESKMCINVCIIQSVHTRTHAHIPYIVSFHSLSHTIPVSYTDTQTRTKEI